MATDYVYSTYDAKARFSEVIRHVRNGRTVTVTYQGDPVAEIRPLDQTGGTSARLEWLRSRGVLVGGAREAPRLGPIATRPGALDRFLADRNG
jgi:prevent-host-death family protein